LVAWTGRQTALQIDTTADTNVTATDESVDNANATNVATESDTITLQDADFTLVAAAEQTVVGEITTYTFADNNLLNVMPADMQSLVLNETPVKERAAITIGETPAERVVIRSAKDGSDVTIVQTVVGNTLYDFRGSADYLSNLSQFINFTY
jgi:hypothetical protein